MPRIIVPEWQESTINQTADSNVNAVTGNKTKTIWLSNMLKAINGAAGANPHVGCSIHLTSEP